MIHKRILVFLIAFLPVIISACSDDDDDDLIGKWYRVSDMDGLARNYASSFTIGNKGYLICGNDGTNYLNDFWEFNPTTNTWAQKADFPGSGRYGAVAFGVNGKAYIGCGYDGNYLKDFYAFNPVANSWTQTISIGGTKRQGATSFVINGIAYVCCGQNNGEYVDDFWKFWLLPLNALPIACPLPCRRQLHALRWRRCLLVILRCRSRRGGRFPSILSGLRL